MAGQKHVVRKIAPEKLADFDEHWWPVTLLLLVTAGCLIGSVYFHPNSDFTTQVWYRNAWTQIGLLGATALLLIVGVAALKGDAQRRLQLGIFLSLIFHASPPLTLKSILPLLKPHVVLTWLSLNVMALDAPMLTLNVPTQLLPSLTVTV